MRACLIAIVLAIGADVGLVAAERYGQVTFGGLPVPGASVVAVQGEKQVATVTDQQGVYRFADLADGLWTIRVEMLGFSTISRDISIAADAAPSTWELTLLPFEEITRRFPVVRDEASMGARAPTPGRQSGAPASTPPARPTGFQRAAVDASPGASPVGNVGNIGTVASVSGDADSGLGAADGFLINGSVNNGAASPFAQLAAFGNNRRGVRSLYNAGLGVILGNAAWDARPFSFTGQHTPKPDYGDVQVLGTFAGPLRIPRLLRSGPTLFLGYQRMVSHNASTQSAVVPSALERAGNFSQTRDGSGRPIQIVNPSTGVPFSGNVIPPEEISPQAASLLNYYPRPNVDAAGGFNYQVPVLVSIRQDSVQSRFTQALNGRNQAFGTVAYQRTTTDGGNLFGFIDSTRVSGLDATGNWSHRFSQLLSLRLRYQFTRLTTGVTPYFANRTNVSGEAGIGGNSQDPINWGPPNLIFSSGMAGLASAQDALNSNQTNAWGGESVWSHGRHNVTFGGDVRRQHWNVLSQQDARGTFTFSGTSTGSDLADFLLGIPHASSIAFGNRDKYLRASSFDAYMTDDWRLSPGFTVNAGMRWEYEAPITEQFGRLVNLDVAPGFTAASPVLASDPIGPLTGQRYPTSLVRPDKGGFQPRIGIALRPVPGSSLVIRAGYGVYRNTSVYQPIAMLLAQQPPLSKTLGAENSLAHPITLADGFIAPPRSTFAVDPNFRVGYARNWQVLVQRDLPASLTMTATYLGTKGSHLTQEFLPNTYPAGAVNPCPTCPVGFVYLTSNGRSNRQAGQFQLRRRLRSGLTATAQYTLSKATDDSGAFTGVSLGGAAIAQDWLNLDAERGPSNFDQRHLLTTQFEYTTGIGIAGGGLMNGVKGSLFKGWTFTSQLTAGSGLPLTPVHLTSVTSTGVTGTIRADVAGARIEAPSGFYANPAAYTAPAPGSWGNAGRNSIRGPAQFSLNAGIARTFLVGDRLNLDWRIDATNVLNRVTYAGVNTIVGSPQFGLPTTANPMRKVQSSLRVRF